MRSVTVNAGSEECSDSGNDRPAEEPKGLLPAFADVEECTEPRLDGRRDHLLHPQIDSGRNDAFRLHDISNNACGGENVAAGFEERD